LYNRSFDPDLLDYDATYENTLHYSAHFQQFARALADRLVTSHHLVGARVAEMGSGPGHFLAMLCERGVGRAFGFDPSYDAGRLGAPKHPSVEVSDEEFPADGSVPVRLALSQHVLEHLRDPVSALEAQRAAVDADGGTVYVEVPNGRLMIEQCALWDLVYEHVSYFVPSSLRLACRRAGLRVTELDTAFAGQFLWCDAVPAPDAEPPPDPSEVASLVHEAVAFGRAARDRIEHARLELSELADSGPVVLWGAGSKGMTYLNLTADVATVAGVVDINPRKVGWGVPGVPLTISAPETLKEIRPRTVLIANPVYTDEISDEIRGLGVAADVRPIWE
jgi:SAM-dependent methyltransferase